MWWAVLVLGLAIIDNISAQNDTIGTEAQTQLCCPCPPGWPGAGSPMDPALGSVAPGPVAPGSVDPVARAAESVDDCPCRTRDADSEGAASLFFPNAVRAFGNVVRPEPKEDPKPLLHPEVDLASSVLETLREATDEEYRDALERDAARAVAEATSLTDAITDGVPEEARNVVTIIVSPRDMDGSDDPMPEASHVQETRCIHSALGNPRNSLSRATVPRKGLENILNLPLPDGLLHRQRDSNLAASNVHESVVRADDNFNKILSSLRLRTEPSLLKLDPKTISENINNILSGANLGKVGKSGSDDTEIESFDVEMNSSNHPVSSEVLENNDNILSNVLNESDLDRHSDIQEDLGCNTALSNEQEQVFVKSAKNAGPSKSLLFARNNEETPQGLFPLTNLFKLSDDPVSSELVEKNDKFSSNVLNKIDSDRHSDIQDDLDCNTSPSNDQEQVFEQSAKNTGPLKSLFLARNNEENAPSLFPLKNLFKLRDVELVPLDILKNKPKAKINIPSIKINPLQNKEAQKSVKIPTLLSTLSKMTSANHEIGLKKYNKGKSANIQSIPKKKLVTTDILDAVPSPSDDNCVKLKPEAHKSAVVDMKQLEDSLLNSSFETVETDGDKLNNVSDMKEVDTDISNTESTENLQIKSNEIFSDDDADNVEEFQPIDDTEVLKQGTHNDIQIISQEDISDVPPGSVDLSEINITEERGNSNPETIHPLRTLGEIRKSVVDTLEALQKSNRNAFDSIKHNVDEIPAGERNRGIVLPSNKALNSNEEFESFSSVSPSEEESKDTSAESEPVSFQDLQKMSDSILMASENNEQKFEAKNDESMTELNEDNSKSEEVSEKPIHNAKKSTDGSNLMKTVCPSDEFKTSEQNAFKNNNTGDDKNTGNDLETLASDPIIDILQPISLSGEPLIDILRPSSKSLLERINDMGTKLRQSIAVQPTPLINADDFNIFRRPSLNIPDISSLNANIPTLDEIRTRVSEILDGLARTASDDDGSSELDSEDFASDINSVVSTDTRSPEPISILPTLKPLEDINLDIIQLKPLPSLLGSSSLTPNLPGLNLNRYKAKLAIPKSLDLKPLNLASTLGNNGGLVGTTLTIGPEKNEKSGKRKFKSNGNVDFVKTSRVASNNNPTLADITSTMHKNALNLLNLPKSARTPNLQAGNVIENIAEKIKSHTEDTVRSIQETFNPSPLTQVHNSVLKTANNLLTSSRNSLQKTLNTPTQIDSVVDNLRSQTQNTIQQLHDTLHSPRVADLSGVIQKHTNSILNAPKSAVDSATDTLRAQSVNTFRNIQQTLDNTRLDDLRGSIHKSAQNILKSSAPLTPTRNLLGNTMQVIPSIDKVADNLKEHTKSTLKNIHQTLHAPSISDISTSIQKSAQQVLKPPITNKMPAILKSALQPSTSIDTVVDNLRSQTQNTMRNIQNSLNTAALADISATVQKHAQNLLESPVALTGQDAFKQVLQASPPINLTPHVEQVAKDLQKSLKATLKNSPIKDLPPLLHPNDVMQMLSEHHENVNDKLYALHTDLTDRLESIHNEVTDPERLRSILSPLGNKDFELFTIPLPMSSRSAPTELIQAPTLQARQPSRISQRKKPMSSMPRTETIKPSSLRSPKEKGKSPSKSFRIPSAASSPIPTRSDRPGLLLTTKKPFMLQDIKKSGLLKPLPKNKVTTIKFGSTTLRPIPAAISGKPRKIVPTTPKPKVSANKRFKSKGLVRQPTPWNLGEAKSAPKRLGEPMTSPTRTTANVRTPSKAKPISSPPTTGLSSRLAPVSPKLKSHSEAHTKPNSKLTPATQGRASKSSHLAPINKTKSPLLTKLTDALKNKQAHASLSQSPRMRPREEMAPGASDRFEKVVALEKPLKENVPYKCKMMCVKVDLNDE